MVNGAAKPSILQAIAALGREVDEPGPMGRVFAKSLVVLVLTELVRRHPKLTVTDRTGDLPSGPPGESSTTWRRT